MSTDWSVHCLDCNSDIGFSDLNHKRIECADFIKAVPALAALYDAIQAAGLPTDDDYGISIKFQYRQSVHLAWCKEHTGHRLAAVSEYGDVDGLCNEHVKCGACKCGGHYFRCSLPSGHDGPHEERSA